MTAPHMHGPTAHPQAPCSLGLQATMLAMPPAAMARCPGGQALGWTRSGWQPLAACGRCAGGLLGPQRGKPVAAWHQACKGLVCQLASCGACSLTVSSQALPVPRNIRRTTVPCCRCCGVTARHPLLWPAAPCLLCSTTTWFQAGWALHSLLPLSCLCAEFVAAVSHLCGEHVEVALPCQPTALYPAPTTAPGLPSRAGLLKRQRLGASAHAAAAQLRVPGAGGRPAAHGGGRGGAPAVPSRHFGHHAAAGGRHQHPGESCLLCFLCSLTLC